MNWPKFISGILFSFLPRNFWGRWKYSSSTEFSHSTMVSGLIECALSSYFIVIQYFEFLFTRARQLGIVGGVGTQLYMTGVLTIEYLLHPLTVVLVMFSIEGFVRATAAFVHDETLPSFPLKLTDRFSQWMNHRARQKRLEISLPDQVEEVLGSIAEIRIACSHPKEGWRPGITVEVREEFYEVHEARPGNDPYPVTYVLRKKHPAMAVRGPYLYEV
jgi:hypothetical protein